MEETLRQMIQDDLHVGADSSEDLVNLIHIYLKKNDKELLVSELQDIYGDTVDIEGFVDKVWNFYNNQGQDAQEENKSEYSEEPNQKVQPASKPSQQNTASNNVKAAENGDSSNLGKRGRPAIYDEVERLQKVENVRNINMKAKKDEKNKQQKHKQNNNQNNNYNNQNNNFGGNKPLPPAPAPKQEPAKSSILDRIIKPGDKGKKTVTHPNKPPVTLSSGKEKITKKVKPNPDSQHQPPHQNQHQHQQQHQNQRITPQTERPNKPVLKSASATAEMQAEDPNAPGGANQGKLKVRCRNWPACRNEACLYHHPTENCKNFPACSFGDKCFYIHPAIPCKFGAFCQRPNCAYVHPRGPSQMQYYGFGQNAKRPGKGAFGQKGQQGQQDPQAAAQNEAENGTGEEAQQ